MKKYPKNIETIDVISEEEKILKKVFLQEKKSPRQLAIDLQSKIKKINKLIRNYRQVSLIFSSQGPDYYRYIRQKHLELNNLHFLKDLQLS